MKTGFKITLGIVGVLGLIVALYAGPRLWTYYYGAEIEGKVQAERQLESAPNRIDKYNMFHDLCQTSRSYERKIQNAYERLDNTEDSDVRDRVLTNINGLRNMRSEVIAKYNSMAHQDYTAARFHDSDLPYTLENERFEREDQLTKCYVDQ